MLTFDFYTQNGGKLNEVDFNTQLRTALNYINCVTFDRLINYEDTDDRLKFLLLDMINMQHDHENSKEISNMATNGDSVSYNVVAAKTLERKQFNISHQVLLRIFVNGVRSNYRG